jgi:hypothetical protein
MTFTCLLLFPYMSFCGVLAWQTCDAGNDAKPRNRTNAAPETARELADDAYAIDHALSAS